MRSTHPASLGSDAVVDPDAIVSSDAAVGRHAALLPPEAAAVASRFGDITPALASASGATIDFGLWLPERNAQARAFARAQRRSPPARHD